MTTDADVAVDVPDVPAAVLGWRQWRIDVVDGRPRLVSPIRGTRWVPGASMTATCVDGHATPADGCGCGLYAARTLGQAAHAADGSPAGMVVGRVALWGDVVEGELGWRATHGYPVVLIVDPGADDELVAQLTADYGVEVRRSPVTLAFLRALPTPEHVRNVRAFGARRQDRIIELLARHHATADAVDPADPGTLEALRHDTVAVYRALRRASLRRVPREVAATTARLYVPLDLVVLVLGLLVDGPPSRSWPTALVGWTELAVLLLGGTVVVSRAAGGLAGIRRLLAVRFLARPARLLFRVALAPFLAASLLQVVVVAHLVTRGQLLVPLAPTLAVVPLGVAALGLVGWRRCFPPVGSPTGRRHGRRPRREE